MIEIIFLGTSSMVPTKERNQSALLINYGNHGILVDCGEGTQRQLKIANIPITKITKILITHWHGDHVLGLPGLIQTLAASEYTKTLEIYGPPGTKNKIDSLFEIYAAEKKIEMKIMEISGGIFFENTEFSLIAFELNHGIPTFGFNFIEKDKRSLNMIKIKKLGVPEGPLLGELQKGKNIKFRDKPIHSDDVTKIIKGKKIGIIGDTSVCDNCYIIGKDNDLLICESTYSSNLVAKGEDYKHMTSKQAALVASKAMSKKLILTHFSARYKSTLELNEDARTYFDNTECAYDFMKVKI